MIKISYSETEGIIRVVRQGSIDKAQILDYIKLIDGQYRESNRLKILTDSTQCTIDLTEEDYPDLIDTLKSILCNYQFVKKAIVISNPSDVALSFLFEEISGSLTNFRYKTFSDKEIALEWLNLP